MGASQSYLYIFLEYMDGQYGEGKEGKPNYKVTSSKGVLNQCDNFEVVTHKIDYQGGDGKYFDIYIYNSKSVPSKASYIFAYCSPRVDSHIANAVKAYYSVLSPHTPLAITFVRDNHEYHCSIDKLREAGWDWASSITTYTSGDLVSLLKAQYTSLAWDRTIQFKSGSENNNIMGRRQEIDNEFYYRVIFAPDGDGSILGLLCMYCTDPQSLKLKCQNSSQVKNQIDTYYLSHLLEDYFAGFVLYFARNKTKPPDTSQEKDYDNTLLLIEFSKSCETKSLKRKDKEGCWWAEEKLTYNDHNSRVAALKKIKDDLEACNLNTVIIDKKSSYICGREVKSDTSKDTFNKYTHNFLKSQHPNIIFLRNPLTIGSLKTSEVEAKEVEVYYLKLTAKDGKEDGKPFLIVFNKGDDAKTKKVYHFSESNEFKDWKEFSELNKLEDKLGKISDRGKCTKEIELLRKLVYRILTTDDVDIHIEPTDKVDEKRPVPYPPPEIPPEGPNWLLIIGSSVGAFVFVCLLALAYGIYWYNTTIKLLT